MSDLNKKKRHQEELSPNTGTGDWEDLENKENEKDSPANLKYWGIQNKNYSS